MYVRCLELEGAQRIDFYTHIGFSLLGNLFVLLPLLSYYSILSIGTCVDLYHLLFIIELAIKLIQLIRDGQEHHSPRLNWVVVVLLHDSPSILKSILSATEEVKVRL